MYAIKYTNQFGKDLKLCKKRGYDLSLIQTAIALLEDKGELTLLFTNTGTHSDLF